MIRVLVAEDSPTARRLLVDILEADPGVRVVGEAEDGREAIALAERLRPDLVLMDVFMPAVDGLEATKEIMIRSPRPIVIVSSAATNEEVGLSLSATRAGALLALPKPPGPHAPDFERRSRELVSAVKAMAGVRVVRYRIAPGELPARRPVGRETVRVPAELVAIAASTGGPAALQRILGDLPGDFPAPVLLVQHIAAGFVDGLVEWLRKGCSLRVKKAEDGEEIHGSSVYVGADGCHLGVGADRRIVLSGEPAIRGFRPSATFLFESAARAFRSGVAAVVLTGMGSDGVAGLAPVREAGGWVLTQDEATSVVFGMAQEALRAGAVDEVLALEDIAPRLQQLVTGGGERA